MKKLIYSCFFLAFTFGQEVTNGGFESNVFNRNTGERILIADRIKNQFPDLNVQIGGQTGLDISNSDKSQIIKFFNFDDEVHFFGDMMEEGQNDYPLARAVKERLGKTYHVKDWEETRTWVNRFSSAYANGLRYN